MRNTFILLVDDEVPFVETMTKRLSKRGLQVISSLSGEKALKMMESNRTLDVVILDVKMPGMDGIQVLQEMKKRFPLVEVIMLTGHATIESAVEGMKLGAFDYLMKPCDIDELISKVREAVTKKREHEERIREAAVKNALSTSFD
jgi:DNA-binding NtrC family response regulator